MLTKKLSQKALISILVVVAALAFLLLAYYKKMSFPGSSGGTTDLSKQGTSTEIEAIESDVKDTNLDNLDTELTDIEKEIDSAY